MCGKAEREKGGGRGLFDGLGVLHDKAGTATHSKSPPWRDKEKEGEDQKVGERDESAGVVVLGNFKHPR